MAGIRIQDDTNLTTAAHPEIVFSDSANTILGAFGYSSGGNSDIYIENRQNADVVIETNDSERVRITGSGNVGIGTTSPTQKLSVAGIIESTTGGIKLPDGTVIDAVDDLGGNSGINNTIVTDFPDAILCNNSASTGNWILFNTGYTTATSNKLAYYVGGSTTMYVRIDTTTGNISDVSGWSPANCSVGTSVSTLYSSNQAFNIAKGPAAQWLQSGSNAYYNAGNVGIGTTAPIGMLEVVADSRSNPLTISSASPGLYLRDTEAYDSFAIEADANALMIGSVANAVDGTPQSGSRNFVIKNDGNVGIGTTTPVSALDIGTGALTVRETSLTYHQVLSDANGLNFIANAGTANTSRDFVFKSSVSGGPLRRRLELLVAVTSGLGRLLLQIF